MSAEQNVNAAQAGYAAFGRGDMQGVLAVNECWEFQAFEPREFIASGELLAVQGYYRAKARKTGLVAESPWVMVWRFQNGKCTHFQEYADTAVLSKALTGMADGA